MTTRSWSWKWQANGPHLGHGPGCSDAKQRYKLVQDSGSSLDLRRISKPGCQKPLVRAGLADATDDLTVISPDLMIYNEQELAC